MFRIESSTSYDDGAGRQLQEVDWRAAQIASDLAVFLQAQLGMEVVIVYSTDYYYGKPRAMCHVKFPGVGHGIARFLTFNNLGQKATPEEWAPETNDAEFAERMLQRVAHSINLILPHHLNRLTGWGEQVQSILQEAEQPVTVSA